MKQVTKLVVYMCLIVFRLSVEMEAEMGGNNNNVSKTIGGLSKQEMSTDKMVTTNMRYLTKLINDMSKYTILVSMAIISSFLFQLLVFLFVELINGTELVIQKYEMIPLIIDSLINCICLILQFDSYKKYYNIICIKCHLKCQNRYTNKTNMKMKNGQQLERLQSGELGFKVNKNDNNTANDNNNNDDNIDDIVATDNEIGLVAQKSITTLAS